MQFDLFDTQSNDLLSENSYSKFAELLSKSNCQKCPLSRSRTNIVVDRGNPEAKIMVIGEGPGENEDIQGKAFVGKAGKLFDKIMTSIQIDTNKEMLICNVVKCRPPSNRAPLDEEVSACSPYLRHQIEIVRPKMILLLGATALKRIDPAKKNFSMEKEAGKIFKMDTYPGILIMVLYHPAALLYNSKLKPAMWEHVKQLKKYMDNGFHLES